MLPVNQQGKQTHNVIPHGQVSRPHEARGVPYVHQAWPTTRYHPNGDAKVVCNEEELADLGPEWREFPYPAKKTVAALAPAETVALSERHLALQEAHASLQASHDALANDKATLQQQVEELSAEVRLAETAYVGLQRQHAMVKGQLAAARKKEATASDVPPASAPAAPPAAAPAAGTETQNDLPRD
jgi:hypothetical protein